MIKKIIVTLLSLFAWLNIIFWPVNKYEWMLYEDPNMMLPIDGEQAFYPVFAIMPIVFLVLFLLVSESIYNKLYLLLVIGLLLGWSYKFRWIWLDF